MVNTKTQILIKLKVGFIKILTPFSVFQPFVDLQIQKCVSLCKSKAFLYTGLVINFSHILK